MTIVSNLVASSPNVSGMTGHVSNTAIASRIYALFSTARRSTEASGTSSSILWSNFDFAVLTRSPSLVANEPGNGGREYFNTAFICNFLLFAIRSILAKRVLEFFIATTPPFLLLLVTFLPTTENVCNFVFFNCMFRSAPMMCFFINSTSAVSPFCNSLQLQERQEFRLLNALVYHAHS